MSRRDWSARLALGAGAFALSRRDLRFVGGAEDRMSSVASVSACRSVTSGGGA
jgi:hypothetical protein